MKLAIILLSLVALSGVSVVYANQFPTFGFSDSTQPKSCIDYLHEGITCFQYLPQLPITSSTNWSMDIIAPNNTCNINGVIIGSTGGCTAKSIVLSQTDFDTLKSNPSVLAVVRIQQSGMPSQDYCPVALWTWFSQDDSFKAKYNETLVVPQRCLNPVPEFGPVAEYSLVFGFLFVFGSIMVMRYK